MTYFDHFAKPTSTPVGRWIMKYMTLNEFNYIRRFLTKGLQAEILEIGPGDGELADLFTQAGYKRYSMVEPNETIRTQLQSRGYSVKNYLIPQLGEADQSFDAIILIDVFEHLNGPTEAQQFIEEARRVLRPGGLIIIGSPDYLHWKEDFFNCDYSHNNVTSARRTLQMFYNNGIAMQGYQYYSGVFTNSVATTTSWLARLFLVFANSNGLDQKFYKLKLNFLRRFLAVGIKH